MSKCKRLKFVHFWGGNGFVFTADVSNYYGRIRLHRKNNVGLDCSGFRLEDTMLRNELCYFIVKTTRCERVGWSYFIVKTLLCVNELDDVNILWSMYSMWWNGWCSFIVKLIVKLLDVIRVGCCYFIVYIFYCEDCIRCEKVGLYHAYHRPD